MEPLPSVSQLLEGHLRDHMDHYDDHKDPWSRELWSDDLLSCADGKRTEPLPSMSQLLERHLRYHIDRWRRKKERQNECKVPSLLSLAADAKVQTLIEEDDIHAATARMTEEFDFSELRHVLDHPKATYPLLRAFQDLQVGEGRCAIDLDDAIIRNERFLLDRSNGDGKYLVSLEDLVRMLPNKTFADPNVVSFARKDPPRGGTLTKLASIVL